jgi:uncharacterized phage infection (PIP) family protein YhgE
VRRDHGLTAVKIGLVVLVASLALVSTGCGGDDEPEASTTQEWAESFCTAITSWRDELQEIQQSVTSSLTTESLEQAADDVEQATDDFVEEVRGLGGPETESGQAIEDSVQEFTDTAEAEKTQVIEAVEEVTDVTDIAGALAVVGSSLQAMATALQSMFDAFENEDVGGELETAFDEAPACVEFTN